MRKPRQKWSKDLAFRLATLIFAKTRFCIHIHFIGRCLHSKVIPKGFRSNFHACSFSHSNQYWRQIQCALNSFHIILWESKSELCTKNVTNATNSNSSLPLWSSYMCTWLDISSYLDKIMAPIVKTLLSYIKDSRHVLEIFVILISLAKTNSFSPWILHLFILSFPMTKVSGPSDIFSINTPLRRLARKHYSV